VGDLQLSTLDYDEQGQTTVTGRAAPGGHVRAYIDDKMVGEGTADKDGRWKLTPKTPIDVGKHTLRLDRLGKDGKPTARLEIPFARQDHEGVGMLEHLQLALVHGLHDDRLVELGMPRLALQQEAWDDPDHTPPGVEGSIGQHTHEADAAAAIDESPPVPGQDFAKFGRHVPGKTVIAEAGATKNADGRRKGLGHGRVGLRKEGSDAFPDPSDMVSFRTRKGRRD
jgi:hypothetical protein